MGSAGLRETKKRRTRELLVDVAVDLFEAKGFDEVTVDEIAEAASVSPRTFFRYFGSKEAVLFAGQDEMLAILRETIASQPASVPPLLALQEAVVALARYSVKEGDRRLRRAAVARTGALAYQRTVLQPQWEDAIAEALAAHLDVDVEDDLRPRLLANVAIAVMSSVSRVWTNGGGSPEVEELVGQAFASLETAVLTARSARS